MSRFDNILRSIRDADYGEKSRLLHLLARALGDMQRGKQTLSQEESSAILSRCFAEADAMLTALPNAKSYKEKSPIHDCYLHVTGIICAVSGSLEATPEKHRRMLEALEELVRKEKYLEEAVVRIFRQKAVEEGDVRKLCTLALQTDEEFHRGVLYSWLLDEKEHFDKLTDAAKAGMSRHLQQEAERYLAMDSRCEDCINNLELMADLGKYFVSEALTQTLFKVLELGHSCINYYLAETLFATGHEVPFHVIDALAKDLSYAKLTYDLMARFAIAEHFPKEYSDPEYLAKSDLVHWLIYPTELGREPDAIEYLGKITYLFKKDVYYVFKYRSDSKNLDEETKNKWLIGWSSDSGGTFSNFDEYTRFEKKTLKATLRKIKRKLIG